MKTILFLNTIKSIFRNLFFSLAEKNQKRYILKKRNLIKEHYFKDCVGNKSELIKMLFYVSEYVPYYKTTISKTLLKKIENNFDYFYDIPIITKKDVTNSPDLFISDKFNKNELIQMKTGGSTGHSMYVYYDQVAADWSSATTRYCRARHESMWCNTQLHFACDFGDPKPPSSFDWRRLGKGLALNRYNIFTMSFDSESLDNYLESLNNSRVNMVHGHPSTMYQIAQHSLIKKKRVDKLFNIFESSGEVIYPYQSETIEKAFGCKIINRYGLAEVGIVAYQMNTNEPAMEIQTHLAYVESSNTRDPKDIIVTTLKNKAMPLIRYNTGDIGIFETLSNGRVGIKEIRGRIHDFIEIENKRIPTHALMDVFDHRLGGIHEWQIHRSKMNGSYKILIVPTQKIEKNKISEVIMKYLGIEIKFEIVTHDKLLRIGQREKFRHLIEVA